jgi:aspartate/methionine/tyrosine aminotransferase
MVAGDAQLIEKFRAFRNVAGPTVPTPLLAASAACWRDEAHVTANRASYRERMDAAEQHSGQPDDRAGRRILSSGWMSAMARNSPSKPGANRGSGCCPVPRWVGKFSPGKTQSNPGFSYVRVALVNDLSTIMTALERLREIL